ncbi:MAG: AMP-binding protein [Eggerthellaceae bacterium]|nr:AMP-binding protein [Eggerthellaceae bacterium]
MSDSVLVSGATGFLGSAIVEELLETAPGLRIYVPVRGRGNRTPEQRLTSLWWERPALREALGTRVVAVEGDIEREHLGLAPARYDELAREVSCVFHAAAEVGVNQTRENFRSVNVCGTNHMLEFAKRAATLGGLQRFVHISTAYVAGRQQGSLPEPRTASPQFNSLYEQSKHEAELLVSAYGAEGVPYAIVRPAQIVGDSRTGFITTFNTLYYPLKMYLKGRLRIVPAPRDLRVNMVPVDYVARLARRAATDEAACNQVLHAVVPTSDQPTLDELVDAVREWARVNLHVNLPAPVYLPIPAFAALGRVRNLRDDARPKRKGALRNLAVLAPYFYEDRTFETARAQVVAGGEHPPAWRAYFPHLLEYATRRGFLNHTDRTVYEQILTRLRAGASTRVDYFDVTGESIEKRAGADVRAEIERIASALIASGIHQGDRIATIGVNSVRYFALDAAIGLVGAVNVPIYYTSPTDDVYALVKASGAKALFAGTDRMLDELDLARLCPTLVAMGERRSRSDLREGITPWSDFIARGTVKTALPWVAPDATATIHYTSGTTGVPKGVVFDQQQVRWMGEVMPAVLDWRTRNSRKVRYLSFLPMSHVVEGILVAYAPYYILADIEMYYLSDFPALAGVLPKVRPNLFFSVPRFYEKVWNQFAASAPGRFWVSLPDSPAKRLLAVPLRYVILRRAGLDRCRQLIVGSAPIGGELLDSFRSLGVEIHNAFGVTEAPLITLSRLGENELGSVGRLLPETEARIGDDGQVYIRGPQVTRAYDGATEPAVDADGWFCTGDMGSWSAAGNLQLNGRAKEILVTSYGKNIAPQKIEVLLKGIDGVSEAMVVADARPFTTALLWLENDVASDGAAIGSAAIGSVFDFAALDDAVRRINEQLSHPEQVKRWIVAARPLTVAAGELTPNLKVRRNVVADTRAELVDALYDGWGDSDNAGDLLHRGEAS